MFLSPQTWVRGYIQPLTVCPSHANNTAEDCRFGNIYMHQYETNGKSCHAKVRHEHGMKRQLHYNPKYADAMFYFASST